MIFWIYLAMALPTFSIATKMSIKDFYNDWPGHLEGLDVFFTMLIGFVCGALWPVTIVGYIFYNQVLRPYIKSLEDKK